MCAGGEGGGHILKLRHVLLSSAIAVGFSTQGSATDLTVTGATTSPLATSAASGGTPGNITITSTGSVSVATTGAAAITINSSNSVLNQGNISNTAPQSA